MSLAPIDFGLGGWKQEIPGTFNPRTGKVEYPKPEIFGRMAGKVFSGDPEDFESAFSVATHDKPFSRYPAAGGSDRWPGMSTDDIKRYVHPSLDPLLNIPITPFGMRAGGPELFPIKKDLPGEVKGTIRGVQGGSRNDLSKPYGGLRKAGMLFANEGLFSA
tara:strand:+ start:81 stop:563 length:483 start_codon:yes stop_codon:yes gene_type:complete